MNRAESRHPKKFGIEGEDISHFNKLERIKKQQELQKQCKEMNLGKPLRYCTETNYSHAKLSDNFRYKN